MATKHKEMQFIIREWKEANPGEDVDMRKVAEYAASRGWPLPEPVTPLERLAKEFTKAAREETRQDTKTGHPYRVYHAYHPDGSPQGFFLYIDIDEAPRNKMHKSAVARREQMVGDAVQLTFDLDHWNRINPDEEPITVPLDFTEDVEWRKNAPGEGDSAA